MVCLPVWAISTGCFGIRSGAEIAQAIAVSKTELQTVLSFFDRIKSRYQEVIQHINSVSKMGTTKSSMFEDIDNMLSQIPPVIHDYMDK